MPFYSIIYIHHLAKQGLHNILFSHTMSTNHLSVQWLQTSIWAFSASLLLTQVYFSIRWLAFLFLYFWKRRDYQSNHFIEVREEEQLSNLDLPMITVCHKRPFGDLARDDNFLYLGYNSNRSFVGWGWNENQSTMDYLESIATVTNVSQLLQVSYIPTSPWGEYYPEQNFPKLDFERRRITLYNGQCYSIITPTQILSEHVLKWKNFIVVLGLKNRTNADVYLTDPYNFNGYFIPAGDRIDLDRNNSYSIFDISSSVLERNPEDPKVSCGRYDPRNFSFAACAARKAEEIFLPLIGCVPPWFSDDRAKICQKNHTDNILKLGSEKFDRAMLGKGRLSSPKWMNLWKIPKGGSSPPPPSPRHLRTLRA